MTILSLLVKYLGIFHANLCNKSYIYIYHVHNRSSGFPSTCYSNIREILGQVIQSRVENAEILVIS